MLGAFIIGAMLLKTSPKHGPALAQRGLMVPWYVRTTQTSDTPRNRPDRPRSSCIPFSHKHPTRWHLALALALVSVSLLGNVLSADMGVFLSYLLPIFVLCVFCMYADRARAHLCCPVTNAAARLFGVGAISRSPISSPKDTKDGDGNNNNTAGGGGGAVRKSSPPTVLSVADFHMATTTLTSVAPASSLPPPTAGSCTWGSV